MLVFMLTILLTYEKACGIIPLWSSDLHWRVQTADPQHIELCSLPLSTEYILQVNYDPKARKIVKCVVNIPGSKRKIKHRELDVVYRKLTHVSHPACARMAADG